MGSLQELDLTRMSHQMQEIILRATHSKLNLYQDSINQRKLELQRASDAISNQRPSRQSTSSQHRARMASLASLPEGDLESHRGVKPAKTTAATKVSEQPSRVKSLSEKRKTSVNKKAPAKKQESEPQQVVQNDQENGSERGRKRSKKEEVVPQKNEQPKEKRKSESKHKSDKPPQKKVDNSANEQGRRTSIGSGAPNIHHKPQQVENHTKTAGSEKAEKQSKSHHKSHKPVESIKIEPEPKSEAKEGDSGGEKKRRSQSEGQTGGSQHKKSNGVEKEKKRRESGS